MHIVQVVVVVFAVAAWPTSLIAMYYYGKCKVLSDNAAEIAGSKRFSHLETEELEEILWKTGMMMRETELRKEAMQSMERRTDYYLEEIQKRLAKLRGLPEDGYDGKDGRK